MRIKWNLWEFLKTNSGRGDWFMLLHSFWLQVSISGRVFWRIEFRKWNCNWSLNELRAALNQTKPAANQIQQIHQTYFRNEFSQSIQYRKLNDWWINLLKFSLIECWICWFACWNWLALICWLDSKLRIQ